MQIKKLYECESIYQNKNRNYHCYPYPTATANTSDTISLPAIPNPPISPVVEGQGFKLVLGLVCLLVYLCVCT